MNKQYTCGMCGGTFNTVEDDNWNDDVAREEFHAHYGRSLRPEDMAVVCEDCYQKIHPAKFPHRVEEAVMEHLRRRLEGP